MDFTGARWDSLNYRKYDRVVYLVFLHETFIFFLGAEQFQNPVFSAYLGAEDFCHSSPCCLCSVRFYAGFQTLKTELLYQCNSVPRNNSLSSVVGQICIDVLQF